LAERLDELRNGDQSRLAIVGEAKRKKAASAAKKSRRKYRKLQEDRAEAVDGVAAAEEDKQLSARMGIVSGVTS
jgi:hypothetical protein